MVESEDVAAETRLQAPPALADREPVVPGLDHLRAGRVAPGLEDLHQPLLDLGHRRADRPRGGGRARSVGRFGGRGQLDEPPVRAVGLVVAVERGPQRQEGVVQGLAALRFLEVVPEAERAAAVDGAVLELQVVADLAVAGGERGREALVVELGVVAVLARRAVRRVRDGRARVAPVRERHAHGGERGLVLGRELLDVERGELVRQRAVAILDRGVPGLAAAALEVRPEAGVDRADRAVRVEEVEEDRFSRSERAGLGGGCRAQDQNAAQQNDPSSRKGQFTQVGSARYRHARAVLRAPRRPSAHPARAANCAHASPQPHPAPIAHADLVQALNQVASAKYAGAMASPSIASGATLPSAAIGMPSIFASALRGRVPSAAIDDVEPQRVEIACQAQRASAFPRAHSPAIGSVIVWMPSPHEVPALIPGQFRARLRQQVDILGILSEEQCFGGAGHVAADHADALATMFVPVADRAVAQLRPCARPRSCKVAGRLGRDSCLEPGGQRSERVARIHDSAVRSDCELERAFACIAHDASCMRASCGSARPEPHGMSRHPLDEVGTGRRRIAQSPGRSGVTRRCVAARDAPSCSTERVAECNTESRRTAPHSTTGRTSADDCQIDRPVRSLSLTMLGRSPARRARPPFPGSFRRGSSDFFALSASTAVFTSRFSSGGGSVASMPSDFSQSSRHQPFV